MIPKQLRKIYFEQQNGVTLLRYTWLAVVENPAQGQGKVVRSQQVAILLVGHDEYESRWLCDAFEETGLIQIVQVVPHAQAALMALRNPDQLNPSLIILDTQSSDTSAPTGLAKSLEVLRELKSDAELRSIPVVIVAESVEQADLLNVYSHGASSFVCKPETLEEQRTLISRFAHYWANVAELPQATATPESLPERTLDELVEAFQNGSRGPIEVLIVDDNENDILLLKKSFSDFPSIEFVGEVRDGEQALRFLRRENEFEKVRRPRLVLMDINMPRKNGFDVLTEMRNDERLSNIPVVMLTTSKAKSDILRAYGAGACSFIAKPVSFDTMKAIARKFAIYWTMVSHIPPINIEDNAETMIT